MLIAIFPLAYLLGSIPSSVWLGKLIRGIDLREHGSGNAGATNAFRVLGRPIGIAVLLLDAGKGTLAVTLSFLQHGILPGGESWMLLRIALGLLAVTGHIFPVLAGFRGGKGVATLAGIGIALHPEAALCAMGVYLLIFLLTRISALGSLAAVLSYPLWMIWVFPAGFVSLNLFSLFVPLVVLITHRENIRKLMAGKKGRNREKDAG